jgi:hypothetical protein
VQPAQSSLYAGTTFKSDLKAWEMMDYLAFLRVDRHEGNPHTTIPIWIWPVISRGIHGPFSRNGGSTKGTHFFESSQCGPFVIMLFAREFATPLLERVFQKGENFQFSEKWIGITKDARKKCARIYKASLVELDKNK